MSCARRGLACAGPPGLRWPGRLSPPPRRSFVPRGRRGPRGASLPPRRDGAPRPGEGPGVRGREREREREGGRLPRPPPLPSPAGAAPRDPLSGGVGGMPLRCSFHSFCSPRSGCHMSRGGGGGQLPAPAPAPALPAQLCPARERGRPAGRPGAGSRLCLRRGPAPPAPPGAEECEIAAPGSFCLPEELRASPCPGEAWPRGPGRRGEGPVAAAASVCSLNQSEMTFFFFFLNIRF